MNKSELRLILEEGEGYKIEFKESLAEKRTEKYKVWSLTLRKFQKRQGEAVINALAHRDYFKKGANVMRLLQKFPKSENRRGILPRNILKINDLSGKMPDLFAAKFDFCKSLRGQKVMLGRDLAILYCMVWRQGS
jgi:hypothetical protein